MTPVASGVDDEHDIDPGDRPGVAGRWVVPAILIGAALTVLLAFAVIKPPPGFEPAPDADRPFGPASAAEQQDVPLIRRGGTGTDE